MVETINSFWNNKRVLVTGCSGFLGSHLADTLLSKGASVIGLIHKHPLPIAFFPKLAEVHQIHGSITDFDIITSALQAQSIEIIFHLAAQPLVEDANIHPLETFESNIRGTWTLLEAARRSPVVKTVVFASSDKAYGDHKDLPYREEMSLIGRHPYDVSKSCADLLASAYFHTYQTSVMTLRCANFYGGGDLHFNRLIPGVIQSFINNERPIIRSDGKYIRDYVYIEDVVSAFIQTAQKGYSDFSFHGEVFNISSEIQCSVLDVVKKIKSHMHSSLTPIIANTARNEIKKQFLSCEKAKHILGWRSTVSFDEGLQKTISWYKNYFNALYAKT